MSFCRYDTGIGDRKLNDRKISEDCKFMLFMDVPLYHLSHFSWFWELPLSAWKDWDKYFFVLLTHFPDCHLDPVGAERIERGDSKELDGICYPQPASFWRQTFLFWPKVSSSVSVLVRAAWLGVTRGWWLVRQVSSYCSDSLAGKGGQHYIWQTTEHWTNHCLSIDSVKY